MVVDDFYVFGAIVRPSEANPPLLVDADAVLSLPIALERFECVTGRNLQVIKNNRPIQLGKLLERRALDVHPSLHPLAFEQRLGVAALEALDSHGRQ